MRNAYNFIKIPLILLLGMYLMSAPAQAQEQLPERPEAVPQEAVYSKYGTWIVVTDTMQREWYANGQLSSEVPLKDGVFHGSFSHYDKDGTKLSDYYYSNGKLERIYNYVIRIANAQRPLSIPKESY